MKELELTKASASLKEYVKRLSDEPLILTLDGRPVAALLDIEDLDWNEVSLKSLPLFLTMLKAIAERLQVDGRVSSLDVNWVLGIPPQNWAEDPRFARYLEDEADASPTKATEAVASVS